MEEVRVAIHLVHRCIAEEAIRKPSRVAHQLAHGRRVIRIDKNHFAVRIHALVDLQVRELRNEFGDGIGGQPLALLVENHHRHACHRLGHGVVAEDRILRHLRVDRHVALTVRAVINHFPMPRQDRDDAGNLLLVHGLPHQRMKPLQSLRGKANRLRLDDGHVQSVRDGRVSGRRLLRPHRIQTEDKRKCDAQNAGNNDSTICVHEFPRGAAVCRLPHPLYQASLYTI